MEKFGKILKSQRKVPKWSKYQTNAEKYECAMVKTKN